MGCSRLMHINSKLTKEKATLYKLRYYCLRRYTQTNSITKHDGHLRTRGKRTFLECSQMSGVFYHSVIHGLGVFICSMKNTPLARKFHTKTHLGLGWRIFHILTNEDIDDFTDIKFLFFYWLIIRT